MTRREAHNEVNVAVVELDSIQMMYLSVLVPSVTAQDGIQHDQMFHTVSFPFAFTKWIKDLYVPGHIDAGVIVWLLSGYYCRTLPRASFVKDATVIIPDELGTSRIRTCWNLRYGRDPIRQTSQDRKSTRLNSSHLVISYAVFC